MMGYHGHTKGHTSHIRLLCEAYSLCLGLAEGKAHSFYSFNKAKIWSKIFPVEDPTVVLKRFSNVEKNEWTFQDNTVKLPIIQATSIKFKQGFYLLKGVDSFQELGVNYCTADGYK